MSEIIFKYEYLKNSVLSRISLIRKQSLQREANNGKIIFTLTHHYLFFITHSQQIPDDSFPDGQNGGLNTVRYKENQNYKKIILYNSVHKERLFGYKISFKNWTIL